MKKSILTMLLLLMAMASFAQQRLISGQITDRDTKEAIEQVTIQLLKSDSTYVAGAISNGNGLFHVTAPANGKYLLKISSVGYKSTVKRIQISDNKDLAMGKVVLGAEAIMLKGAVVTAMAQKVTLKEDTFVYNSSAYRTPEGSVVEELVKRLPGAEVSDDGTIKINGKEVKKILVDGKEFMTGDTKTALKNLPTSIIEKIKAYDEKSDLSKVTGIDDGEEQTVLDFGVKKGMNKGLISNIDLGVGNKSRYNMRGMLQVNRKLGNKGRNITFRMDAKYTDNDSKSISLNNAKLYLVQTAEGKDSTYQTNRYNLTPSKNYSYAGQLTYSEPLWKATFLQFSYKFTYSYSKSDRSTYDFSKYAMNGDHEYRGWDSYLNPFAGQLDNYKDEDLSKYSEYKNYTHDIQVMMRFIRSKYNLNFGVMIQPQRSNFIYDYMGNHKDTVRTVTNFSPTLDFRYRFSKMSNLRVNYRGTTSQPSISQLLDITDNSDPLNISKGNPGLKPSFTQNFRLFYNNFVQNHNRGVMTFINFSTTNNSISNKVTYDEKTGGRITRPENINGNWNVMGAFMFNCSIDSAGVWNLNTDTNLGYNNYVSYLSLDKQSDSQKNTTRSTTWRERLSFSYRNDWLELSLDGTLNYNHAKNKLQPNSNLDTWQFSYGPSMTLTAPWGTSLNSSLSISSRRGYNDSSMNTDEFVWNAQLSQSFLKGKPLTIMLQFYDILRQQSTFSRAISATSRTDTEYNAINSYAMLHVVYRLNLFGGKQARQGGPGGPGGPGGRPDFRGRPFNGGHPGGGPGRMF